MLAFISNFGFGETVVILILAVLIFGRRLPEVAAKAAVQVQRFRRQLLDLRRESGIDEELRQARRALYDATPRDFTRTPVEPTPPPRPQIARGDDPAPGPQASTPTEEGQAGSDAVAEDKPVRPSDSEAS